MLGLDILSDDEEIIKKAWISKPLAVIERDQEDD